MRSVVRIVKREERERSNNSPAAGGERAVQQSTPELIVKSWITASRERRRAQTADYLRDFKRWEANWNVGQGGLVVEPCSLGLTPTASIAVILAISDALALTLMDLKKVSKADYGLRHHGGHLGRKARQGNLPN